MFEKNLKLAYLLDFYGDVLAEQTKEAMEAYYDDDLSLSEIGSGMGISRQGVRHIIKKGEDELTFLEERLGLAEHHERFEDALRLILEIEDEVKELPSPLKDSILSKTDMIRDIIKNK